MSSARVETNSGIIVVPSLRCESGESIDAVRVAYTVCGDEAAPPVLVLGGISAGRHLLPGTGPRAGWWPSVVGAGAPLDPARWRLVGVDYVGGRGDSSAPDDTGAWPVLTTHDQATAIVHVLDALGIERLHAVVGASFGGMVALALAERYAERIGHVVVICAAHRSTPMATAIRSIQRRIVSVAQDAHAGVGVARALAITTYRTAAEFDSRFDGLPRTSRAGAEFPVDSYLDHHARDYAGSFPPAAFLALSQSLDLHRVDPRRITCDCTLIGFDTDTLVPIADIRALGAALPEATVKCISTAYGHDGFLKEPQAVGSAIEAALAGVGRGDAQDVPAAPATHYAARASTGTRSAATAAVRAGIGTDAQHGAVIPPIHLSTTFEFEELGAKRHYDYTRSGNPTRDQLASAIAELEHAAAAIITPTGMAAVAVTLQLLRPGDLLIAAHDGYGGTYRLIQALARKHAFAVEFIDLTSAGAAACIRERRPRMVWVETPSNPLLRITDIAHIAAAAHDAGALCVADNTFLSPALQNPIDHGADIVIHSTTKYLNGHSDVVGGAVAAADAAIAEELGWWANCTGATGSPFDSYLTLRGIRTLHPRMRAHQENAASIVDLLHAHPAVQAVHYPGLPTHPGHDLARQQQRGFGAMLSFELAGGDHAIRRFLSGLRHFSLAESLGGVESLVAHPATMTHASMDAAARATAGISDNLLRLSIGIEDPADLTADLERGLARVLGYSSAPGERTHSATARDDHLQEYQSLPVPVTTSSGTSSSNALSMSR